MNQKHKGVSRSLQDRLPSQCHKIDYLPNASLISFIEQQAGHGTLDIGAIGSSLMRSRVTKNVFFLKEIAKPLVFVKDKYIFSIIFSLYLSPM